MKHLRPVRLSLLLASAAATLPCGAQFLPINPPTVPTPIASAPAGPKTPAQQPAHRARVELSGGQISVVADNSSLNQILREIGRLTGMKITGGVTDERVFGDYGPADTSAVLSTLLGGTGSNMLLIQDSRHAPQELVLTPRQGGPTPPNPNATADAADDTDLPPQLMHRFARPGNQNEPLKPGPAPAPALPVPAPAPLPTPPPADTTTQESPNGVKTPQQIYDQLMKMQQQQPKPPGGRISPP